MNLSLNNSRISREPVVRLGVGVHLPSILESFGCDSAALIRASGLNIEVFNNPKNRVSLRCIGKLLASCAEVTNCEHFGLLIGQKHELAYAGAAGFAAMSASTVGDALETIKEFLVLSDEGGVVTLERTDAYAKYGYMVVEKSMIGAEVIQQMAMVACFNALREFCGPSWQATEIWLSQKKPKDIRPFRNFYQTPIRFDASENAIIFKPDCLTRPLSTANPLLHDYLMEQIVAAKRTHRSDLKHALTTHISLGMLDGERSLEDISSRLGIHPRTLNRRLKNLGTTFKEIRDRVRSETSASMLTHSDMPIAEVAAMVGYSNSSSFSHAFQRWYGVNPRNWRESRTTSQQH